MRTVYQFSSESSTSRSQLLPTFQLNQAYCEGLFEFLSKIPDETPSFSPNLQDPHKNPLLCLSSTECASPMDVCCLVAL